MTQKYHYIGCFFEPGLLFDKISERFPQRLSRTIKAPHVTFAYRPDTVNEALFGEKITVRIVSYGNDGTNEGVGVELFSANKEIIKMAEQIEVPHITLSVSRNGKPVNTRYLQFFAVEPFEVTGVMGGYTDDGQVTTTNESAR